MTRRFLAASLLAAVAFAPQAFATVTFLPGSSPQQAPAGKAFAPILMRVTNAFEHPVAGATVQWSVPGGIHALKTISFPDCGPDGFGFGLTCRTATDADGIASIPPMIGNWALTHELSIWSAYGDAKAVLIVDPLLDPPRLRIVGGDQQRAVAGTAYASPLRLRAERSDGSAVAGAKVRFLVTGPPYVKFPNSIAFGPDGGWAVWITTTDADGNASSAPFEADLGLGSGVVVAEITDEEARATSSTRFSFTNTNAEGGFTFDVGHDLWWGGPQEGGWAISITQHRDQLFAFLLAYDEGGNPTWAMLPGGQWSNGFGGRFDAGLYSATAAPFYFNPVSRLRLYGAGALSLSFRGEQSAEAAGGFSSGGGVYGFASKAIQPFAFAGDPSQPARGVSDLWWGGPAQRGWALSIVEKAGGLFTTWMTYGTDARATWFVMPEGRWTSADTFEGPIYRTTGSLWAGYDASKFRAHLVGSFRLQFAGREAGTFEYTVDGRSGTLPIERFSF